jgi:hypothetical protein
MPVRRVGLPHSAQAGPRVGPGCAGGISMMLMANTIRPSLGFCNKYYFMTVTAEYLLVVANEILVQMYDKAQAITSEQKAVIE